MLIMVVLVTAFTTIGAAACFQVMQSSGAFFTQAVTCTFYKCMKASLTAIKYRPLRPSTQRSSPAKPKKASDGAQLELTLGCIEGSSSIEYLPTSDTVAIAGQDLAQLSVKQLEEFRLNHIGFIFQQPQLLDGVTLRENAILPAQWHSKPHQQAAAADADRWFCGRAHRGLRLRERGGGIRRVDENTPGWA